MCSESAKFCRGLIIKFIVYGFLFLILTPSEDEGISSSIYYALNLFWTSDRGEAMRLQQFGASHHYAAFLRLHTLSFMDILFIVYTAHSPFTTEHSD